MAAVATTAHYCTRWWVACWQTQRMMQASLPILHAYMQVNKLASAVNSGEVVLARIELAAAAPSVVRSLLLKRDMHDVPCMTMGVQAPSQRLKKCPDCLITRRAPNHTMLSRHPYHMVLTCDYVCL